MAEPNLDNGQDELCLGDAQRLGQAAHDAHCHAHNITDAHVFRPTALSTSAVAGRDNGLAILLCQLVVSA